MRKKGFFSSHAKSSAALVSLGIHAVLIVVALFFVAVTVIQKDDQSFEAKPVNRPRMQLKKLQVPINVKKKSVKKPKLRKRIVVQSKMNSAMPDIKMPEITGFKGGLGAGAGGGLGAAGGVGFSMPEVKIFGVKSRGEKICIILDSSPEIMADELGGIPAYTIIKDELIRILGELPSTALFNIIVYDPNRSVMLFPSMVSANSANVAKADEWLKPLNAVRPGMGNKDYGVGTLGTGGMPNREDMRRGIFKSQNEWYRPTMIAMRQQADAVFLLTCWWGNQWHYKTEFDKTWYETPDGRKWRKCYEEAKGLLAEENKERTERGKPPRVIRDAPWEMNTVYFPNIVFPPTPEPYHYTARDFVTSMLEIRNTHRPKEIQSKSGLRKKPSKSKIDFSFNVVHFRAENDKSDSQRITRRDENTEVRFRELVSKARGDYKTLAGLEAIQSSISPSE